LPENPDAKNLEVFRKQEDKKGPWGTPEIQGRLGPKGFGHGEGVQQPDVDKIATMLASLDPHEYHAAVGQFASELGWDPQVVESLQNTMSALKVAKISPKIMKEIYGTTNPQEVIYGRTKGILNSAHKELYDVPSQTLIEGDKGLSSVRNKQDITGIAGR
jgi:hypothetical protein